MHEGTYSAQDLNPVEIRVVAMSSTFQGYRTSMVYIHSWTNEMMHQISLPAIHLETIKLKPPPPFPFTSCSVDKAGSERESLKTKGSLLHHCHQNSHPCS